MKQLFLLATMLAFILSACSNDNELGKTNELTASAIEFRSLTDKSTRAAVTDGDNILSFTVSGMKQSDNGYLFDAFGITRGETDDWAYTPLRYWPASGNVDFYAYSPTASRNVETGLVAFVPGTTLLEYEVPTIKINDAQEDFLIAKATNQNESTGAVKLNFQHALSRVTFSAKTRQDNITYIITGVSLMNLMSRAKLDFTDPDIPETGTFSYPSGTPLVIWEDHGVPVNYSVDKGDAPIYMTTDFTSLLGVTNGLMVMPQETELYNDGEIGSTEPSSTEGFAIKVSYRAFVDGIDYAGTANNPAVKYFPVAINKLPITFEIGRQYNFYLTFGDEVGAPIRFEVEVSAWNETTNVSVPNFATKGYFPDPNFLNYILNAHDTKKGNGDVGSDGTISYDELEAITEINVPADVTDLTGVELMPNLTKIIFSGVTLPVTIPVNKTVKEIEMCADSRVSNTEITKTDNLENLQKVIIRNTSSGQSEVQVDLSGYPKINDIRFDKNVYVNIGGSYVYGDIISNNANGEPVHSDPAFDFDTSPIPSGKLIFKGISGSENGAALFVETNLIAVYYACLYEAPSSNSPTWQ